MYFGQEWVKPTKKEKQIVLQEVKRELKQMWPMLKDRIKMEGHYPAIRIILFRDNKLFVPTYKSQNGSFEFFIFDKNGNFLETLFLPLATQNPLLPYPFDFYQGKLYQLAENEDLTEWELHRADVK